MINLRCLIFSCAFFAQAEVYTCCIEALLRNQARNHYKLVTNSMLENREGVWLVGLLGRHQNSNCKGIVDIIAQTVDQEKPNEDGRSISSPKT